MSTLKDINAALLTAYKALGLNLPTAYELRDFVPPASAPWAQVYNRPADRRVATLGDSGEDQNSGFFQINFYVPENSGTAQLLSYADTALVYFKAGRSFTYNGQVVKVRRSSPSPIRKDDGSAGYLTSVTVYWDSRSLR